MLTRRVRRFLFHTILHADDTPHSIALGAGIGVLVAFSPLIGLHTLLAVGLAALLRANKAVCVPMVWIINPFNAVPVYGACWALGRAIVPSASGVSAMDELRAFADINVQLLSLVFWKDLWNHLLHLGVQLWVGCGIVGAVSAIVTYGMARWGVAAYRRRHHGRKPGVQLQRTNEWI